MSIVTLQRKLREIGRIRIGEKVTMPGGKSRPKKLETFRFTSKDQAVIEAAAELYGGTAEPFEEPLSDDRWQVTTQADSLAIVIPPSAASFSQYLELWTRGGCQRRCTGEKELLTDGPCICAQEHPDPQDYPCKPHTRLSVMLQDLPGLGVWRLDSQGYYAATELAGAVDVCAAATARGQMLPARLRLEQRSVKRPGPDGKPVTLRFVVPVLDVDVTVAGLLATMSGGEHAAIGGGGNGGAIAALESGPNFTPIDSEKMPEPPAPPVAKQVAAVNEPREKQKRSNAQAPLPGSGRSRRQQAAEPEPDAERRLTDEQRTALQASCTDQGWSRAERLAWASEICDRKIASFNDIRFREASALLDWFQARPQAEDGGLGTPSSSIEQPAGDTSEGAGAGEALPPSEQPEGGATAPGAAAGGSQGEAPPDGPTPWERYRHAIFEASQADATSVNEAQKRHVLPICKEHRWTFPPSERSSVSTLTELAEALEAHVAQGRLA